MAHFQLQHALSFWIDEMKNKDILITESAQTIYFKFKLVRPITSPEKVN